MKNNLKKIFLAVVLVATAVVCFSFSASAANVLGSGKCGANLTWTVYDDLSLRITGTGAMFDYEMNKTKTWDKYGKVKKVIVESGVTGIGNFAFDYNENLKYVSLADTVEEIGRGAFMNSGLTDIDMSDGLKKINHLAFSFASIEEIDLPEGLEYLGNSVFSSSSLSRVRVPSTVKEVGDFCFSITPIVKAEFAEGVEKIGVSVFSQCFNLAEVSLPSTLKSIGDLAFYRCSALKSLTIPQNVSIIGDNPFSRCTQLNLEIHNKNTHFKIKNGAVYTSNLKEIIWYPYTSTSTSFTVDSATEIINGFCFEANTTLKTVILPDKLKVIENAAFNKCSSLVNIEIPDSVTEIQTEAFSECSKAQLELPAHIEKIGNSAFYNCDAFRQTNLYLPDSLKTIDNSAFLNCDSITQVSMGNIEYMGERVFSYCDRLETVVFREGISALEIDDSFNTPVFEGCASLKNITLPQSLEKIGDKYFSNIPNLEKIVLPKKLTTIGAGAFYNCTKLKEIDFSSGKSLKEIGSAAFANCSSLTAVDLSSFSELKINDSAFYGCTKLKTVKSGNYNYSVNKTAFENAGITDGSSTFYMGKTLVRAATSVSGEFTVTNGTVVILNKAFLNCTSVKKISIPASVTSVASDAFSGCGALKEIYYDGSLAQWNKLFKGNLQGVTINVRYSYIYENEEFTLDSEGNMRILTVGEMENYHPYIEPSLNPGIDYGNGSSWYNYNGDIKSVQFVNKITRIGHFAFDYMYNLSDFSIPSTVKSIGYHAFDRTAFSNKSSNWNGGVLYKDNCALDIRNDSENITVKSGTRIIADNGNPAQLNAIRISGIKKISIPSSVENVGRAFAAGYTDLAEITVSADNKTYAAANGILFSKDKTQLISYPAGKSSTTFTVPAGVKSLGSYAFALSNLKKIYIPESVTYVGDQAFERCYDLEEIYYYGTKAQWEKAIGDRSYSSSYLKIKVIYDYHDHTGKTAVRENVRNATCLVPGEYDEVVYCKICSKEMSRENITVYATGHKWDAGKITTEATCIADGVRTYTCTVSGCGETKTGPADKRPDHKWNKGEITTKATCAKEGIKTYTCTVTGCKETKIAVIAKKTTHTWNDGKITTKPTCVKEGIKTYTCKVSGCGKTRTEAVAKKTTHSYSNKCDKSCNVCKATRKITHSYKNVTTKATLKKNGKIENKCSVCGTVKSTTTIYHPKTIKLAKTKYTYNGKAQKPSVTVKDSKGNKLKKDTDYTVKYPDGRKKTGKYTVTVTFKGKYSGTKKLTFTILPSKTSSITPTLTATSVKASWKKVTGADGYKVELINSKGKVIKSVTTTKTAYTFKKLSKATTYKVKVTAYKTIDKKKVYSLSSTTITTSTAPTAVTLSKVTAGKKQAALTWKTASGASGYEVMYSTSKKFKKAKTVAVKKGKTKKTTIKKLTKGKKYYFKVRAYKTVDGKKIYGGWSAIKSVKVK